MGAGGLAACRNDAITKVNDKFSLGPSKASSGLYSVLHESHHSVPQCHAGGISSHKLSTVMKLPLPPCMHTCKWVWLTDLMFRQLSIDHSAGCKMEEGGGGRVILVDPRSECCEHSLVGGKAKN